MFELAVGLTRKKNEEIICIIWGNFGFFWQVPPPASLLRKQLQAKACKIQQKCFPCISLVYAPSYCSSFITNKLTTVSNECATCGKWNQGDQTDLEPR